MPLRTFSSYKLSNESRNIPDPVIQEKNNKKFSRYVKEFLKQVIIKVTIISPLYD